MCQKIVQYNYSLLKIMIYHTPKGDILIKYDIIKYGHEPGVFFLPMVYY